MKGLEISVVSFSEAWTSAETRRLDSEYFQKQHLADEALVKLRPQDFHSFAALGLAVDGSAFYPAIESYYGTGNLPFLRVANVDTVIDFQKCTRIPAELCDRFPTLSRVHPGDIVFTKGGSVARIGWVTEEAAASRDLIFINSSQLPITDSVFLYVYAQTGFFNRMLLRSSSQTAQPHLTITLVRNLPIFRAGKALKDKCVELVERAFATRDTFIRLTNMAETTLNAALGLADWEAPDPLTYSLRKTEAFAEGRLDAEYHRPKVDALRAVLAKRFELKQLSELGDVENGQTVPYDVTGEIPIIRSGDLSDIEDDTHFLRARGTTPIYQLEIGDVLISSIGFGSIGKVQVFDKSGTYGTVSEITVVRQHTLNPYFVTSFLRSKFGQMQIDRFITGATGQLHLYKRDVRKIFLPILPGPQQKQFEMLARKSAAALADARTLLAQAKRAVEIAIEESEVAAMKFLKAN